MKVSDTGEVPLVVAHAGSPGQRGSSSTSRKAWRWMKIGTRLRLPCEGFQTRGLTGTVPSSSISLALWQMKTTRKQRDRPILMHFWSAEGPDPRMVRGHGQAFPLPCHLWRQKACLQSQPPLQGPKCSHSCRSPALPSLPSAQSHCCSDCLRFVFSL